MLDTSQNVIPDAQITTSQPNFAKANSQGQFVIPNLAPGEFVLQREYYWPIYSLVFAGISAGSASRIPLVFHELFYCHGRLQRSRIGLRRSS